MAEEKKVEQVIPEFKFDTNTILALLYLMYKTNNITRRQVKDILAEVKKEWPKDMAKWLVSESIQ